jgi:hypothetical protein
MKERPILFSGPMVRALLDGSKTQTRRVVKRQPHDDVGPITVAHYEPTVVNWRGEEEPGSVIFGAYSEDGSWGCKSPFGAPDDHLWVRESGILMKLLGVMERPGLFRHDVPTTPTVGHYWVEETRAAGASYNVAGCSRASALLSSGGAKVCPSIHMPRWASRITLEITGVRVERLQDITESDAHNEGAIHGPLLPMGWSKAGCVGDDAAMRSRFAVLWDGLAAPGSDWDANPWVWVVEFKRLTP